MALIRPFRGIFFNLDKVNSDDVVAPPYDIISPELKEELYKKSPYNIVRVDFGKDFPNDSEKDNKYIRAKKDLEEWLRFNILIKDKTPFFYAYEADYWIYGLNKKLRGLVALVRIDELGNGIFPHEATYSKPKADRLNLMRSCEANISPIYSLYNSPQRITSRVIEKINYKPILSAKDMDGAIHKLYRIEDLSVYTDIENEFSNKAIYIADGHHRYEVALEYRNEQNLHLKGKNSNDLQPHDFIMMFLANIQDEGISILPTHRLVRGISSISQIIKRISPYFDVYNVNLNEDIRKVLSTYGRNSIGLYVVHENYWYVLKYRGIELDDLAPALRSLDVVLLHELLLKRLLGIEDFGYEMNLQQAIKMVNSGMYDAAFFLNPTEVKDVENSALSNVRMPPKSTYFYPKLLTGLIINSFK
ncbi:MAG: DUF1015 domain-containing protein [Thermodesulfovibrionales bacterium]|nr:DUF1015 domain-containing protein [Thermodesulfovibrionales bacterium]